MYSFSHEYLLSILSYCQETGVFLWKERPIEYFADERAGKIFNTRFSGKIAGSVNMNGYRFIEIDGRSIRAHRLVFFYVYGEWPHDEVDHINGDRDDNRLINLRSVSGSQNMKNSGISARNTSGFTGVTWHNKKKKWIAQARDGQKNVQIGSFASFDDAVSARKMYNAENGFHEMHGNKPSISRAGL